MSYLSTVLAVNELFDLDLLIPPLFDLLLLLLLLSYTSEVSYTVYHTLVSILYYRGSRYDVRVTCSRSCSVSKRLAELSIVEN